MFFHILKCLACNAEQTLQLKKWNSYWKKLQKQRFLGVTFGHVQKNVLFSAKAWHWCLHLHLDHPKFNLSSWVVPSVPMIKPKDHSFQIWTSHRKQTKHSGYMAIFFTVIFVILVERKCILQKWYSFIYRSN